MIFQLLMGMVLYVLVLYKMFLLYSKRYDPRDPDKNRFGHRPVMKYITKLSCGHITERLQMDSGNLIKYELEEGGGKLYAYRKWCGKLPWQGRTNAKKGRNFQDASRIYRSAVWKRGSCSIVICWKAPAPLSRNRMIIHTRQR